MRHFIMTAAIAACCMGSALADDAGREPVNEPVNERVAANEKAVRQAVKDYVAAFNTGDAQALAAMWSEEAVYTNPVTGVSVTGRDAIAEQFSSIFEGAKGARLEAVTESVEFISPGVALEQGTARVILPDEPSEETTYSAIYVKQGGKWLLDRVTEEDVPTIPSQYEHLRELEWLIGSWLDQDDENRIETTYQWARNRNFITCFFKITAGDRVDMAGMQIIGWDPAGKHIRSWVFDSHGGFGEGVWTHKGDRWQIQTAGTLADGSKSSAVTVITRLDDNAFSWQSVSRVAAGQILPNVDEVIVTRQPAE